MTRTIRRFGPMAVLVAVALMAPAAFAAVYAPIGDASLLGRAPAVAVVRAVASESGATARASWKRGPGSR